MDCRIQRVGIAQNVTNSALGTLYIYKWSIKCSRMFILFRLCLIRIAPMCPNIFSSSVIKELKDQILSWKSMRHRGGGWLLYLVLVGQCWWAAGEESPASSTSAPDINTERQYYYNTWYYNVTEDTVTKQSLEGCQPTLHLSAWLTSKLY